MRRFYLLAISFMCCMLVAQPALAQTEESAASFHSCPICGLCPAPLNICLFLIAIIIVAVLLVVLLLLNKGKRCPLCHTNCKKDVYMCPKCGYDFDSGLQSTMAIRVADSPELMALRGETVELKTVDVPIPGLAAPENLDTPIPEQKEENLTEAEEVIAEESIADESIAEEQTEQETQQAKIDETPMAMTTEPDVGVTISETAPQLQPAPSQQANTDPDIKYCPHCGTPLPKVAMFCGKCGQRLD